MKQITDRLEALTSLYSKLAENNMNYYRSKGSVDDFSLLIGDRASVIDDSELLISEIKNLLKEKYPDTDFDNKNLINMMFSAVTVAPDLADYVKRLSASLQELIDTDKLVEKRNSGLKDSIKTEIAKSRKDAKSIQGYKQFDTYGSCFINKLK